MAEVQQTSITKVSLNHEVLVARCSLPLWRFDSVHVSNEFQLYISRVHFFQQVINDEALQSPRAVL